MSDTDAPVPMKGRLLDAAYVVLLLAVAVAAVVAFFGVDSDAPWWLALSVCFSASWAFWDVFYTLRDWRRGER